jgi:glycerol-1-phosphatase
LTGNEVSRQDPADGPRGCAEPLSEHYDAALLDLDGVVYLGGTPIEGAADALAVAAKSGMRLAFVTNNASRTPSAVAAQLSGMGIPATGTDVVTSAQAAARLIAGKFPAGSPVLVVGAMSLRLAMRERGLRPVSTAAERPVAVVQGYGPGIGYGQLAEAGLAVRAGAWFVATNADLTLPTARGLQPGNGALVQVIVSATGEHPVVAGKPQPPLHAESVERVQAKHPLVVGDRLDTDIEGGVRGGADSLLVLTGVTAPADVLLAPPQRRPTYLAADLTGLNSAHPEVTRADGSFSCGGWTVAAGRDEDWLAVSGSGSKIDGLRALSAAAWSVPQPGPPGEEAARRAAQAAVGKAGYSF